MSGGNASIQCTGYPAYGLTAGVFFDILCSLSITDHAPCEIGCPIILFLHHRDRDTRDGFRKNQDPGSPFSAARLNAESNPGRARSIVSSPGVKQIRK